MLRRTFLRNSLGTLAATTLAGASYLASETSLQKGATRRILYVLAGFSQATPQAMHAVVETIGASRFNVIILSFLQASFNAGKLTLLYNGNEFSRLSPELPSLFTRLRTGFSSSKQIMLSIGGWQQLATFQAIRGIGVSKFVQQLTEQVVAPLGLEGIDLDLEPQTGGLDHWIDAHHEYGKTLVDLTNEYKRVHPAHRVTHAPLSALAAQLYAKPAPLPGLPAGLLAATRTPHGNNIDWLNVQFYEGGLVANGDIAGFYRDSLARPLAAIQTQTGVANPLHFFLPLFQPEAKQPLAFCRQTIQAIDRRCADLHLGTLNGVALWEYRQVAPSIRDWSDGLTGALAHNGIEP